jgi:hypothetical protein
MIWKGGLCLKAKSNAVICIHTANHDKPLAKVYEIQVGRTGLNPTNIKPMANNSPPTHHQISGFDFWLFNAIQIAMGIKR